ncbi:MAG: hypothetical protein ACYC6O_10385 [Thermoleophilia bacterium]
MGGWPYWAAGRARASGPLPGGWVDPTDYVRAHSNGPPPQHETTTIGLYDPATATFYLKNSNTSGAADNTIVFGNGGGWMPLRGDWDGDGTSTVGLYDPTTATFYLRNSNTQGTADITFQYGNASQYWLPVVGDWDGNGTDTVGLYDQASAHFYLKNSHSGGAADVTFLYGNGGSWVPITGDWDGNGSTTVGLYDPAAATFYLRNSNTQGLADITFIYGNGGAWVPLGSSIFPSCDNHDRCKGSGSAIYFIERSKKRWVPDMETVNQRGGNVKVVFDSNLSKYPNGRQVPSIGWSDTHDNVLIKNTSSAATYVMKNGSKRYLSSYDLVDPWDSDFYYMSDVRTISDSALAAIPEAKLYNAYFSWYDNVGAANWVLMANPSSSPTSVSFNLSVAGQNQQLGALPGMSAGMVPNGSVLYSQYPGLKGGPVTAGAGAKALVSQRILWGNSLEEVVGTDESRLSDNYYWPWYDQKTPGYLDWVMLSNPGTSKVTYEVKIAGAIVDTGAIEPGKSVSPSFAGIMGGPVEVKASGKIIASQRVLSAGGSDLTEMPGIPAGELSERYIWTWYDQSSAGSLNWVMIANPGTAKVNYEVKVAGSSVGSGSIDPGKYVTPAFAGTQGGPLEVIASGKVIASQRVTWGASFEETAGYPYAKLKSSYAWTWYDQKTPGSLNWVMIANPGSSDLTYTVKVASSEVSKGTVKAHNKVTPSFPNVLGGPVEVTASGPVMASQRVLWGGYFVEVVGAG